MVIGKLSNDTSNTCVVVRDVTAYTEGILYHFSGRICCVASLQIKHGVILNQ